MKTASISTKWVVEVYPFDAAIPTNQDFNPIPTSLKKKIPVLASKTAKAIPQLAKTIGLQEAAIDLAGYGVTAVAINRSKSSPDGECNITVVGPLPKDMNPGSWVIVSTISKDQNGQPKYLMRFIGQIFAIDVNYSIDESGLRSTSSQVKVREWSYAYRVPVRYDIISLESSSLSANAFESTVGSKILSGPKSQASNAYQDLNQLLSAAFDPYTFAHVMLQMIGAINQNDILPEAVKKQVQKLPDLAVTMPSIPQAVLERLGIQNADPQNPFASGFVKVVTGLLQSGTYNKQPWDGIWKSPSIDDIANKMKTAAQNMKDKPFVSGLGALLQQGVPAWDILNNLCENTINEVFTDMWYEPGQNGTIVGRPVLVVRDKPFLIKTLRDNPPKQLKKAELGEHTLYDNIPRVFIPSEQIRNFRINNNVINSPNYIRASYSPIVGDRLADAKAALAGVVKLDPEMRRFGGNFEEFTVRYNGMNYDRDTSSFKLTPNSGPEALVDYFERMKNLFTLWHAYDYRMANGILILKDDNIAISLGMNVQFQIGNYTLVGHVEQVEYSYNILQNGLEETSTMVSIRRICKVEAKDGSIGFIDPGDFGNLYYAQPTTGTAGFQGQNAISALDPNADKLNKLFKKPKFL